MLMAVKILCFRWRNDVKDFIFTSGRIMSDVSHCFFGVRPVSCLAVCEWSNTVRGVCRISRWPGKVPSLEEVPQKMRSE